MVTEKNNDVEHDFFKDGIQLRLEGDWLMVSQSAMALLPSKAALIYVLKQKHAR